MHTLTRTLLMTTAIGLAMTTAALADNNKSYATQQGNDNKGSITQGGTGSNQAGTSGDWMLQTGNDNKLDVDQMDGSLFGVAATPYLLGIDQTGNWNVISDTQQDGQLVQVQQTSTAAPGASGTTNKLTVDQTSNFRANNGAFYGYPIGDFIGSVKQVYTGSTGGADKNDASITQDANGNGGIGFHGNSVGTVSQQGTSNKLTIDQTENGQYIGSTDQNGAGNKGSITEGAGSSNWFNTLKQAGVDNLAVVNLTGTGNGGALYAYPIAEGAAGHPNNSSVIQTGVGNNQARLDISGNYNQFGVVQNGDGNDVGSIVIGGDSNAVGTYQNGTANTIDLAAVDGDHNDIGLTQNGSNNQITGHALGDHGDITVSETGGDNNNVKFRQGVGADNDTIDVGIVGGSNVLNIGQNRNSTGSYNVAYVRITGSHNNEGLFDFSGPAGDALSHGLDAGDLIQEGSTNTVNLNVTTSSNDFATYQDGSGNQIYGTVNTGTNNQAVITQVGASNYVNFTQSGMGNNIGVTQ